MGDSALFGFGVFVVLIFLAGVVFTIQEFRNINEDKQRDYKSKDMNIRKESE